MTSAGARPDRPAPPGPLAVEAALLLDALRGLASGAGARRPPAGAGPNRPPGDQPDSAGSDAEDTVAADATGTKVGGAKVGGADTGGTDGADGGGADGGWAPSCGCAQQPCTACPVCRLAAAFTAQQPALVRHLVAAGESLSAALRVFLDTVADSLTDPVADVTEDACAQDTSAGDAGYATGTRSAPAPRPRVQRIEIT